MNIAELKKTTEQKLIDQLQLEIVHVDDCFLVSKKMINGGVASMPFNLETELSFDVLLRISKLIDAKYEVFLQMKGELERKQANEKAKRNNL